MKKNFQDRFAVIDLETLGVGSDSVILSLGLTVGAYSDTSQTFESLLANGLAIKFDIKEQLAKGRKTSRRVIDWWKKQDEGARKILFPTPQDVSLYNLSQYLDDYFAKVGFDIKLHDMYDRNSFDLTKLQYLYEEELNQDVPWDYHQTFDIPTAFRFMGFNRYAGIHVNDIPGATYHDALHDAAVDQLRIYRVLHSQEQEQGQ